MLQAPALMSTSLLGYQVRYRAVSLPGQPSLSALPAAVALAGMPVEQQEPAEAGVSGAPWVSRTVRGGGAGAALRQEVVLLGLESFTRYEVTVRAFNEVGAGPASLPTTSTTMEGGELDTSQGQPSAVVLTLV